MSVVNSVVRRPLLAVLLVIAAFVAASVSAAVFVYYPLTVTLQHVKPPVIFEGGSNANATDLNGNTIEVYLGENRTSATIVLHPTYQRTYYHEVLNITNNGTSAYYVMLRLAFENLTTSNVNLTLILVDATGGEVDSIVIEANNTKSETGWIKLDSKESLRVDFEIEIPEGIPPITGRPMLVVELIYSPQQSVTPP